MNRLVSLVAGISAAALIAGCGGTSLNSNVARIRAFNGASGTTAAATIYINNGSANGNQAYEQVTNYLYVNSGTSSFSWSDNLSSGGLTAAYGDDLSSGSAYSAILFGRSDLQTGNSTAFLDITLDDQTAPPAGDSRIRLIPDAPDAGTVDIYVNGALEQAAFPYPGTTLTGLAPGTLVTSRPFSSQNFSYINVPAGTVTIEFKKAGTSTVLAGPTTFSVGYGQRYSFFLMEPVTTPTPAYSIYQLGDTL